MEGRAKNSVTIFITEIKGADEERKDIAITPVESGEYTGVSGQRIRLDLSQVNRSLRGPKFVEVEVDGDKKTVALSRIKGRGYQTLGTGMRLGVELYTPKGVTR